MSSLREKERAKEQQVKFQAILSALLKDEDNKYCIDCDAKGPRWASWNLGIFMCIRCAGIHRNLGVHISKVKSVNLDTWTAEQVAMMQEVGNSRGRAVYEANIPDGFRRPQSDSALEAFIRSKYEQKKYIAREWVPPQPKVPKEWLEDSKSEKKRNRPKTGGAQIQLGQVPKSSSATKPVSNNNTAVSASQAATQPAQVKLPQAKQEPPPSSASSDLLGLDLGPPQNGHQAAAPPSAGGNELLDLFGGPQPGTAGSAAAPASNADLMAGTMNGSSTEKNLFEGGSGRGAGEEKKASTKDSIMALFGGSGGGGGAKLQQMYNIPGPALNQGVYNSYGGMYMPQGQQQAYPGMMGQPQGMMGQQQGMMGQPQGMMGQQQGMMGQPQGMMGYQPNMMGQQGMMGAPAMNGSQMGMYNNQMMPGGQPGGQAMYTQQQMLQFNQMQQQMAAMNMGRPQQVAAPGWGANPGPGHTLSNNLWQ